MWKYVASMMISIVICAFTLPKTIALAEPAFSLGDHSSIRASSLDHSNDRCDPDKGSATSEPEAEPEPEPEPEPDDSNDDDLVAARLRHPMGAIASRFISWRDNHLFTSRPPDRLLRPPIS